MLECCLEYIVSSDHPTFVTYSTATQAEAGTACLIFSNPLIPHKWDHSPTRLSMLMSTLSALMRPVSLTTSVTTNWGLLLNYHLGGGLASQFGTTIRYVRMCECVLHTVVYLNMYHYSVCVQVKVCLIM